MPPDGESGWSHTMIAGHLRERDLPVSPATAGRVLAQAKVRLAQGRGRGREDELILAAELLQRDRHLA